jgi:hypothetical protein
LTIRRDYSSEGKEKERKEEIRVPKRIILNKKRMKNEQVAEN